MTARVKIGTREIGPGQPCFVIAEAGINHNGDPALAAQSVAACLVTATAAMALRCAAGPGSMVMIRGC